MKKKSQSEIGTSLGTYYIYVDCRNCNERSHPEIKRGQKIEDEKCPNCGCQTLRKTY
jgi:translation initiation factor 2 beta subunit (eIF-2beta)/eIF-5